jgi:hypothetical protein
LHAQAYKDFKAAPHAEASSRISYYAIDQHEIKILLSAAMLACACLIIHRSGAVLHRIIYY